MLSCLLLTLATTTVEVEGGPVQPEVSLHAAPLAHGLPVGPEPPLDALAELQEIPALCCAI